MAPVLVVDDDAAIRECVAEVLSLEGFRVVEARDGREGLELLEAQRPSVVVLDLMMPVMSGWDFRREQRRRPTVADIPVIVVSAYDARGIAADRVLAKPFDLDTLTRAVHELAGPDRPSA